MKKNKTVFIFFSLICFVAVCFSGCKTTKDILFSSNEYIERNIDKAEDYLITEISYPEFNNYPTLNKQIEYLVLSNWKDFKEFSEDSWNEVASLNSSSYYPPFTYSVDYNVTYSGNIISIYFTTYTFSGGAHGITTLKTINYDKETKRDLSITESTNYTYEELSDLCNKSLYKQFIIDDKDNLNQQLVETLDAMREEGTAPYAANFENYVLDGNKVIIYFEPYKVAPYSYGIPEVELAKK